MQLRLSIALLLVSTLVEVTRAQPLLTPRVICLSTLEWPPYVSAHLPDQGASAHVLRNALARHGITLHLSFYPWRRAIAVASEDVSGVQGYFPEYRSPAVEARFRLSTAIGHGPLGLAMRRDSAFDWQVAPDLRAHRLGVVAGYVNTATIDADITAGRQAVLIAGDDVANLRRLAIGRIEAAVIDANVFAYLVANEPRLAGMNERLAMHPRRLEEKTLHVAFSHTRDGDAAARAMAVALANFDMASAQERYLRAGYRPSPSPVGDAQSVPPCHIHADASDALPALE